MQPCPRIAETGFRPLVESKWREDGTCSYCGSISPEIFLEACRTKRELGPTDKNYKVYVDLIEPEPDKLRIVSAISWDPLPEQIKEEGWIKADQAALVADGWGARVNYRWMKLERRGPIRHGKFYFQHLSDEQRTEFIELLNNRALNIGIPGHFYVLPFFLKRV